MKFKIWKLQLPTYRQVAPINKNNKIKTNEKASNYQRKNHHAL